jgi:hypothetical protein
MTGQSSDSESATLKLDPDEVLKHFAEGFALIYNAGLWDELSPACREFVSKLDIVKSRVERGEGPRLEPRLPLPQYISYIGQALKLPSQQSQFWVTVVKVVYAMLLIEKNPMVAASLQHAGEINEALAEIGRY